VGASDRCGAIIFLPVYRFDECMECKKQGRSLCTERTMTDRHPEDEDEEVADGVDAVETPPATVTSSENVGQNPYAEERRSSFAEQVAPEVEKMKSKVVGVWAWTVQQAKVKAQQAAEAAKKAKIATDRKMEEIKPQVSALAKSTGEKVSTAAEYTRERAASAAEYTRERASSAFSEENQRNAKLRAESAWQALRTNSVKAAESAKEVAQKSAKAARSSANSIAASVKNAAAARRMSGLNEFDETMEVSI
jgi:colicin import membrane protein